MTGPARQLFAVAALVEETCRRAAVRHEMSVMCQGAVVQAQRLETGLVLDLRRTALDLFRHAREGQERGVLVTDALTAAGWLMALAQAVVDGEQVRADACARNCLDAVNRVLIRTGTDVEATARFLEWAR